MESRPRGWRHLAACGMWIDPTGQIRKHGPTHPAAAKLNLTLAPRPVPPGRYDAEAQLHIDAADLWMDDDEDVDEPGQDETAMDESAEEEPAALLPEVDDAEKVHKQSAGCLLGPRPCLTDCF